MRYAGHFHYSAYWDTLADLPHDLGGADDAHREHERRPFGQAQPPGTRYEVDEEGEDRADDDVLRATEPVGPVDSEH